MATQRPKNRHLEHVADSQAVRRSPRLSGRLSTHSGRSQLLSSNTYSVPSRRSLKGYSYSRGSKRDEVNILNESGQSVPASFDEETDRTANDKRGDVGVPPHLYGLDESDSESSTGGDRETPEVHTPVSPSYKRSKGILSRSVSCVCSALYKCGSLIYLAATGVLCLDVLILHRFFHYKRSQRGLCYYLFLPLILAVVLLYFLGGGLIQGYIPEPRPDGGVDMDAVFRAVTTRVQNELNVFKASFRSDIQDYLNSYVNEAIQASESKTNLTVEEELASRDRILMEQRKSLMDQFNALLANRTSALEARLKKIQEDAKGSSLADASMRDIAGEVASERINSVKAEWLAEAKQQLNSEITTSMGSLRVDLLGILNNTEATLTKQLEEALSERLSSLSDNLTSTQDRLDATVNDVFSVKTRLNTHESQIEDLQAKHRDILSDIAQFKETALEKITALETKSKEAINAEQAVDIFYEELDKTLANENSALRLWLAEHMTSADNLKEVKDLMSSINREVPPGGLTRSDVAEVVRMALERYSADKIGKFDFALENSGGSVVLSKCSPTYPQSLSTVSLFGIPLWRTGAAGCAKLIIKPEVYPGDCWALNGTSGYATIKLKGKILVTEVSVEHIPKELAPNGTIDSAPRDFSVYGLSSVEDDKGTHLGSFSYDKDGTPIQQFEVKASSVPFEIVRFSFKNNHGNPDYTCVYRVRVHGHYPK